MAKLIDFTIVGKIGDQIHYRVGDETIVRRAPQKVEQTDGTKKRASEFGQASTAGKFLRQQLKPVIFFQKDQKMQRSLQSKLSTWLQIRYEPSTPCAEVPFVSNFQFTQGSTLRQTWWVDLKVSHTKPGMLELKIPAFIPRKKITIPRGALRVNCDIAVAAYHVERQEPVDSFSTSIEYPLNGEEVAERIVPLPIATDRGNLVVTAISLQFFFSRMLSLDEIKEKGYITSQIVSAMYF